MELRHLRYFVVTAQAENFTRAAEQLGIAQPPLGQQIRDLEDEIGTPLFHRVGRGVVLSDAGKAFLVSAQDILARAEDAQKNARRVARGEVGSLNLGFTESASFNDTVTGLIRRYQQQHPKVEVNLEENNSESLISRLGRGEIDAAFVRPPFAMGGDIDFITLSEEPLIVVLPDGHPLTSYQRLSLADLRQENFILYSRKSGYGLSADIVAACRQSGFNPIIRQQAPQLSSAVNLVSAGMGIAVVPASMQRIQRDGLHYRALGLDWPKAILGLATRTANRSTLVEDLISSTRIESS
ncbi:LysR family transcriptional regulator [Pseudomonas putida]|uniref:LysR family transcriptional regulator n=1 Tax=Pseudomonas putida TaxID=303 RepID=UPI000981BB10|nr:LysR family transcriptional regulator [Pseudomonas putida]OMQ37628.1 LysR family transcriptional regulator [Pseudomonas putida]